MSLNQVDPPPPTYSASTSQTPTSVPIWSSSGNPTHQSYSPQEGILTLNTSNGILPVFSQLHIINDLGVIPGKREMYITTPNAKIKAYYVDFPSKTTAAMLIHRGDEKGPIIGQVSFLAKTKNVEIMFSDGDKISVEDVDPYIGRVKFRLPRSGIQQTFYWGGTEKCEHKSKCRGRVGDMELVDETGEVYGVFLNEWHCSETKGKNCVGQLNLFNPGFGDRLIDYWVITLLALVERYVLMSNVRWGKIAAGVASGATAFCVIS
jgi:hypothetical protein